jgi:pimeloyl-ACP methyl ester carboxylesterase
MRSFVHEHAGLKFSVAEAGDGPAMVFQHGLCGNASQAAEVFPSESGWRCLTLECRGHGQSEVGAAEELSIATFADDVASLIEAQVLGPVVLGGISMGAAIALHLAVRRPALVRALVLARPAWMDERAPSNLGPNVVVGELLGSYSPDEARRKFESSDLARKLQVESPDNVTSLLNLFSREPQWVTRELLCRIGKDGPDVSRKEIAAIHVPTLVIGQALDYVHPIAMARELAGMISGARMLEVTPKSQSIEAYRRDLSMGLLAFLREMSG